MTDTPFVVLIADADTAVRARVASQLAPLDYTLLEAPNGDEALRVLKEQDVRVVLCELYLRAGHHDCLIRAIRRTRSLDGTRTLAHTKYGTSPDRTWAQQSGADAYLIQPTRAERLRNVVSRLATATRLEGRSPSGHTDIIRRDSLEAALDEMERGGLHGASSIIFSREWWSGLPRPTQTNYRVRARKAHVSLRSDSNLGSHFVEVRGPTRSHHALSTERPESPYRRG